MAEDATSHMRVFLSADLVGSTKLKNRLNHQELLARYRSQKLVVEKLRSQGLNISREAEEAAILESIAISADDFDWASVVGAFYQDLHTEFVKKLSEIKPTCFTKLEPGDKCAPWKAVGDELIYEFRIYGREDLHKVTIAFLAALRESDLKRLKSKKDSTVGLRIKGAGWVAGFPVRNRQVTVPPDSRPDYLGPDMDAGFRVAKCTRAGMLVASVEMAELLGECGGEYAPMLAKIVGWEVLPGVWNDMKYPVIWIDFPDSHPEADKYSAVQFTIWEQEECRWCKCWEESEKKRQLSDVSRQLSDIRVRLPSKLGIVDPYILKDELEKNAEIDRNHSDILELLNAIEAHRREASKQDTGTTPEPTPEEQQQRSRLFEGFPSFFQFDLDRDDLIDTEDA